MILDYYKNYRTYVNAVPGLEEGMAFVHTLLGKPVGTYRTETEMYAMVQEGDTYDISSDLMETHRKFLDVQFVFSGQNPVCHGSAPVFTQICHYFPVDPVILCHL